MCNTRWQFVRVRVCALACVRNRGASTTKILEPRAPVSHWLDFEVGRRWFLISKAVIFDTVPRPSERLCGNYDGVVRLLSLHGFVDFGFDSSVRGRVNDVIFRRRFKLVKLWFIINVVVYPRPQIFRNTLGSLCALCFVCFDFKTCRFKTVP